MDDTSCMSLASKFLDMAHTSLTSADQIHAPWIDEPRRKDMEVVCDPVRYDCMTGIVPSGKTSTDLSGCTFYIDELPFAYRRRELDRWSREERHDHSPSSPN